MKIPVFHDDQHGTAIVTAAAIINGLKVVGKQIDAARLVVSGAGAAAIACLDLLVSIGLKRENVIACDSKGVIYEGRNIGMDPSKRKYATTSPARDLATAIAGADIFLGLSVAGALSEDMVRSMAPRPLILALANPDPEIRPERAKAVRPDCVIATGRSDYPNQVNNVLCFPFIFRGALDVGATSINEEMKLAATLAIARLAEAEQSDVVAEAYGVRDHFGPDHLIPRPFDPRLITTVAPAVAEAAMKSGVATRPIADLDAYKRSLDAMIFRSGAAMQAVFAKATGGGRRIVYAEGEDERVLRAAQIIIDEKLARPILIGHTSIILEQIRQLDLRLAPGVDFDVVELDGETVDEDLAEALYQRCRRGGLSRGEASNMLRRNPTMLAAMLVESGRADGMLCGLTGRYNDHLAPIRDVIGMQRGTKVLAALNVLILGEGTIFLCDTQINPDPDADQLVEMTLLAAAALRRFGVVPRAALVSHSSFGSAETPSARKMRLAAQMLWQQAPELETEGEMQGDAALSHAVRERVFPRSNLSGDANLLIMPNLDAANITLNCLRVASANGVTVGPILLGTAKPAHVLLPQTTVRGLINMTAMTAVG
jgi:malate dehydrogenase (oxaloacetate-decarboxylating)(NADP+)